MVRSSFRSGYTSKSSHTFEADFCSFYSKFSLNRHLYKSDYNSIKNGNVRCGKEQGEMADSLARTKLNVFLSFKTVVYSSICFYDTVFLVLPNTSFVVSAEKVLASGIAGAYLFFFFCRKTQWIVLVCKKRPSNGNSLSLEMKTHKYKLQLHRSFGKNALLKYQWVANGVNSSCHKQFLVKYRK